jgi:hypothetical protein
LDSTQLNRRESDRRHQVRNYLFFAILTLLSVAALSLLFGRRAASEPLGADGCRVNGAAVALPDIPETSGVAFSLRTPGLLWTHKDQGSSVLYAVDERGTVKGRVRVSGVTMLDWEDLAAAPCGKESCLYLADIGDNGARRREISLYRVREPAPGDSATERAEAFHATYPDGPRDAEALIVTRDGQLLIVTKGNDAPVAVYRFPQPLRAAATVTLEKLGTLAGDKPAKGLRVTGGSASPDGARFALRTHDAVLFYDAREFLRGRFEPTRFDVTPLAEPQGEGVALGPNGALALTSEGGRKGRPGSLARAVCS